MGMIEDDNEGQDCDDIDVLLYYIFKDLVKGFGVYGRDENVINEEVRKFYKLVEEGKQELYSGCKNFFKGFFFKSGYIYLSFSMNLVISYLLIF